MRCGQGLWWRRAEPMCGGRSLAYASGEGSGPSSSLRNLGPRAYFFIFLCYPLNSRSTQHLGLSLHPPLGLTQFFLSKTRSHIYLRTNWKWQTFSRPKILLPQPSPSPSSKEGSFSHRTFFLSHVTPTSQYSGLNSVHNRLSSSSHFWHAICQEILWFHFWNTSYLPLLLFTSIPPFLSEPPSSISWILTASYCFFWCFSSDSC